MEGIITELILKPFLSEKIRVLKYTSQYKYSSKLMQTSDPRKIIKGITILQELALSYPYKRQEIVNTIQKFLRDFFPQQQNIEKKYLEVLECGIRSITTIPRYDENNHPLNIDIHQIRIEGIIEDLDLTGTNFKDTTLWGCQFINVILSRSNFENADLGGTMFVNCSLEYANLKGAKLCDSPEDNDRPSQFNKTKLWGSNLEEADIDKHCQLINNINYPDLKKLDKFVKEEKLIIK